MELKYVYVFDAFVAHLMWLSGNFDVTVLFLEHSDDL